MFPRSDRAKRRVAIAAFLGLCVLPTLGVLAWALGWRLPMHVSAEARDLSRLFGSNVSLTGVEHPRPGVVRYDGVELVDPETDMVVLRCRTVQAAWRTTATHSNSAKRVLFLSASGVEIEASGMDRLGELVRRALTLRLGNDDTDVHLALEEVVVQGPNLSLPFAGGEGLLCSFESGVQASVSLRPADPRITETIRIRVGRDRRTQPPSEWFELHSGQTALPCSLLAAGIGPMQRLGPRATFRGSLGARRAPSGWEGTVGPAEFDGVDLAQLIAGRVPHELTGAARIGVPRAAFRENRLVEMAAAVSAGPGTISRALVEAASKHLNLEPASNASGFLTPSLPYSRLAFGFALDERGLQILGHCVQSTPPATLMDQSGPVLGAQKEPCSVTALLRALGPDGDRKDFPTLQASRLAVLLPLSDPPPASRPSPPASSPTRISSDIRVRDVH